MKANSEHIFIGDSEMAVLMRACFAGAENVTNGSSPSIEAIATGSQSFKTSLNILLSACSPMFLVWGSDRILFYNDPYSLLLRANDQPIVVGQPISKSWNKDWQQIQSDVEQVFATGQPLRCKNQPFPGDRRDKKRYYTWSYSPLWNEAGQVEGVFATGCRTFVENSPSAHSSPSPQDLEEALYRREEQLRLVTNAVPALIAYVDKDHYYRFNNQTYEAWFGEHPSDLTGRHIRDVLGEEAYEALLPYMKQALSGQRVSFESQVPYRVGGTRYISANYVPHINSEGIVEGYFSLVSNITERKQAEEALRESEARIQLAVKIGRLGSWRYDPATNLVELDQRMREIWGEPDDVTFVPLPKVLERIHRDDQKRVVSAVTQALNPSSSGSYEIDYRIRGHDGVERWISANGQVQFEGEGAIRRPVEFIGTAIDITDRKQTEMALLAQEQRYRYIFEAVSISIWEEDFSAVKVAIAKLKASGVEDFRQYFTDHPEFVQQAIGMVRLQDVNQATLRLFGAQSKAELLDSLHKIFTPEAEAIFVEELLAIAAEEPSFSAETVLQTLQGDRFHVWFTITFPSVPEAYDHVLVSLLDISDRVHAETALRESEARFRGVVESNMVGIFFWDASGHITAGNEMAVQMLGYSQEELQSGQVKWQNITPPEFHETDAAMQAQLLVDGVYAPFEKAYIRKDGTQVPILIGGALLPGYSDRGVAYFVDITNRKQVENALRQSEERYRCLAESIPQLVWTANVEGTLLDVNQRWIDFTGLTLQQAQVEGWQAVIHPDDIAGLTYHWAAAQQNNAHYQAEGRMRRADGVYRWYLHQAVPLKDAQGNILKWFGTATDIEEQKQLQQEREYLLQREQAARTEAEAANRVKDEFLAVLSHELRSPLNPILGWSRLLQNGKLDAARTKQALATIERNAKLQAELIEDLLDVSRILQGKLNLTVGPVNLETPIQAAVETVRLAAEAKFIRIETELVPTGQIAGDATRLQQVMWNLLSNAVKFTPSGGQVKVRLSLVTDHESFANVEPSGIDSQEPSGIDSQEVSGINSQKLSGINSPEERSNDPGQTTGQIANYAQITVTDTGKGIAANFLPHVFDTFRQADSATTRQFGGLGLGLAIARHLVELHGGTITVTSPGEEQGSTFTVRLPLLKNEDGGMDETDPLRSSSFTPYSLAHLRILLVDDDTDTREFVAFLLEQSGAKVTAVKTAAAALTALKQSPPDILLSDIGMPDMDGYMLMRQVRTLPPEQGGQVKAIALTAYAGDFNQRQALAAGFQQHIAKPIEPDLLIRAIAALTGTLPNQ